MKGLSFLPPGLGLTWKLFLSRLPTRGTRSNSPRGSAQFPPVIAGLLCQLSPVLGVTLPKLSCRTSLLLPAPSSCLPSPRISSPESPAPEARNPEPLQESPLRTPSSTPPLTEARTPGEHHDSGLSLTSNTPDLHKTTGVLCVHARTTLSPVKGMAIPVGL